MSVQSLIVEADKLLEKSKFPEAIKKLKQAIALEPLNGLITTKLANAYTANKEKDLAGQTLYALAKKLTAAEKNQVAIAYYKQAIELLPHNLDLRTQYTFECEAVGKVSEAMQNAKILLRHFLARKKYFDAANIMPLLVRLSPNDEDLKLAWIEIMELSMAEHKLINLLVAFSGPPGMVSKEVPQGGDPSSLSEKVFLRLATLAAWFPKDTTVPYAVAWAAYKKNDFNNAFAFIYETLRRDTSFTLAYLLFARILSEQQKLNEALFVYKLAKQVVGSDKWFDKGVLIKLLDQFILQNGWISFVEDSGEESVPATVFLENLTGKKKEVEKVPEIPETPSLFSDKDLSKKITKTVTKEAVAPGAEIEMIDSPSELLGEKENFEIEFTGGGTRIIEGDIIAELKRMEAKESPLATPEMAPAPFKGTLPTASVEVSLAAEVTPSPLPAEVPLASIPVPVAPAPAEVPLTSMPMQIAPAEIELKPELSVETNAPAAPSISTSGAETPAEASREEKVLSPLDVLAESREHLLMESRERIASANINKDDTNIVDATRVLSINEVSLPAAAITPKGILKDILAELASDGERTVLVNAKDILKMDLSLEEKTVPFAAEKPQSVEEELKPQSAIAENSNAQSANPSQLIDALFNEPAQKNIVAESKEEKVIDVIESVAIVPAEIVAPQQEVSLSKIALGSGTSEPTDSKLTHDQPFGSESPDAIDLGDDLLEGPTRQIESSLSPQRTVHFIKEFKKEIAVKKRDLEADIKLLVRKAERYIAKRNYYLARKVLKHAGALGADENLIREKLREVRKLELPDALYYQISTDGQAKAETDSIIDQLESEFSEDYSVLELGAIDQIKIGVNSKIEEIADDPDYQTSLDFGVALYEMGLFLEAESLFAAVIDRHPDIAYDAYYLMAISKLARKDFAGAASILDQLGTNSEKSEADKIDVFYALGEVFRKMGQEQKSQSYFERVAKIDSNYRMVKEKIEK